MTKPHDSLVKTILCDPLNAAGLLLGAVGDEVAGIDLAAMELLDSNTTDRDLTQRHGDITFSAPVLDLDLSGDPVSDLALVVQIPIEHQSSPDQLILLRILEYMVRAWCRWTAHNPEANALPGMLPVLINQGRLRVESTTMHDLVETVRLGVAPPERVPQFEPVVINLIDLDESVLASWPLNPLTRTGIRSLNHGSDSARVAAELDLWLPDLGQLDRHALATVLYYLGDVGDPDAFEDLNHKIIDAIPEAEAIMTTYASTLREQGREQGLEESLELVLSRLLESRSGPLPAAVKDRIAAADSVQLNTWIDELFATGRPSGLLD